MSFLTTETIHKNGELDWHKCEDELPPQVFNDMSRASHKVLVWGRRGWPQVTYYCHAANAWFGVNDIPFDITHWAYFNEPSTE